MKKEITPILLLISAILISIVIIPLGIIYNACKAFYHSVNKTPLYAIWYFFLYWFFVAYQIWNALKYMMTKLAISLDLIWNATSGEMIEDFVTAKEKTLFGHGNITISAATGQLEESDELNKTGKKFSKFLSAVLGKNHCLEAWKKETERPINS